MLVGCGRLFNCPIVFKWQSGRGREARTDAPRPATTAMLAAAHRRECRLWRDGAGGVPPTRAIIPAAAQAEATQTDRPLPAGQVADKMKARFFWPAVFSLQRICPAKKKQAACELRRSRVKSVTVFLPVQKTNNKKTGASFYSRRQSSEHRFS